MGEDDASRKEARPGPEAPSGSAMIAGSGRRRAAPFLLGLNAQIAQLLILREALVLSSGSEAALGLCLGAWALLNGLGAVAGGILYRAGRDVGRLFVPLLTMLPIVLAGSLHLTRISRSLTGLPGAEHLPMDVFVPLAFLAVGPVTIVDGFLFVSGLAFLFGPRERGRGAAFTYGVESLGALAGGLLFSFLLVFILDPFSIAAFLVAANILFLPPPGPGRGGRRRALAARAILLGAALAGFAAGPRLNRISEEKRWAVLQPEMTLLETRESPYQNLAVLGYKKELTLFGNGGVLLSMRPQAADRYGDWNRAVFPNFAMLEHRFPKRVLLIGGGCKGYLTDILFHRPERVDWIEYDGEMISIAEEYLLREEKASLHDPRVRRHVTDGRFFVSGAPANSYDLIVLDLPDPVNASANRYYTLEFFRQCSRVLGSEGVLVFDLTCQRTFIGPEMMARNGSIIKALAAVFPRFLITPGRLSFIAASREGGSLTLSPEELKKRYEARGIETDRFSPYLFFSLLERNEVAWINGVFKEKLAEGDLAVNRDGRPAAYFEDYLLWRRIVQGAEAPGGLIDRWFFGSSSQKPFSLWFPLAFPLAGLLLLLALLVFRAGGGAGGKTFSLLLFVTAAAVGFDGIVLELAILLSYQGLAGYLYSRMGVIIASYMAGLALGSLLPLEKRFPAAPFLLSCCSTFLGVTAALLLPGLCRSFAAGGGTLFAFAAVTAVLGASGGAAFRGALVFLERDGRSPGAVVYALDIFGTSLGGLIAGSVLVPSIGIEGVLLLAGGINLLLPLFVLAASTRRFPARGG